MALRFTVSRTTLRLLALVPILFVGPIADGKTAQVQSPNALANVEILIIRHAERDGAKDELLPAGVDRAKAYADYFKPLTLDGRKIKLTHLFAEKSKRTRLTLEPLAKSVDLPLDTRFATKQLPELVEDLKQHSYGNEVLICWHHSKMPAIISALGGKPKALLPDGEWPDDTYDWIIDLRYDATGHLSTEKCIHEHLMPGDSK